MKRMRLTKRRPPRRRPGWFRGHGTQDKPIPRTKDMADDHLEGQRIAKAEAKRKRVGDRNLTNQMFGGFQR